jgi:hypothetical protein
MSETQNTLNPIASDIKQMIDTSRENVAVAVNSEITLLYWKIGKRINEEVLGNERAEYGKQVVSMLAKQLTEEYGKGWGEKQLRMCMHFVGVFADEQIVYALRRQLSWTHIKTIMFIQVEIPAILFSPFQTKVSN